MNWINRLFGVRSDAGLGEDVMQLPPEDAECMLNGKAIDIKYRTLRAPVYAMPDDVIVCRVDYAEVVREKIGEAMVIDTVATFRVRDALGFKHGISSVFGERKRSV